MRLYLLVGKTAILAQEDNLLMTGDEQIQQSLALYQRPGQPSLAAYRVPFQEQQAVMRVGDQCFSLPLLRRT